MSPYIGREFNEVKAELESSGEKFSWEITRAKRSVFDIDEKDLYVLQEKESLGGERRLVLGFLCKPKAKGGEQIGI
ncbi:MAG: RNA-3-phosphate cyclase [Selenomonadaceae bacterium]|nr:RNA-3-phosphate cyclase [Selenomonadaceae bacterium]MBR3722100.1 RNA-3-phosphate cyclase [Selenomonadaceae bacterium]